MKGITVRAVVMECAKLNGCAVVFIRTCAGDSPTLIEPNRDSIVAFVHVHTCAGNLPTSKSEPIVSCGYNIVNRIFCHEGSCTMHLYTTTTIFHSDVYVYRKLAH